GVVVIENNDPPPIVRIYPTQKTEGNPCDPNKPYTTAYMRVELSEPAQGWEVVKVSRMKSSHTAIYLSDVPVGEVADWDDTMDGWPNVTVTFNPGETLKELPVHILRDCIDEEDEYQEFILYAPVHCQLSTVKKERRNMLWIRNDDTPAVADFEAAPTVGIGELDVCFKNLSEHANRYLWDFGDKQTSTEKHPCHTYSSVKKYYTVTLKAWRKCCPDDVGETTKTNFITVRKPTVVNFTAAPLAGKAPLAVTFTNCCGGLANSFDWQYGDGCSFQCQYDPYRVDPTNEYEMAASMPTHVYEAEGTFDVSLEASGQGGTDKKTVEDLIYVNEYEYLPINLLSHDSEPYRADLDWNNAIDNNPFTYVCASKITENLDGPGAEFEFADQAAKMIHKIRLMVVQEARRWSTGYTNEILVLGSMDQESWTEIYVGEVGKHIGVWDLIELTTPAEAKYVKVILSGTRGDAAFSELAEIIFLGEEVALAKGLAVEKDIIPTEFALAQNYPNPFNPETTISISLPEMSQVSVKVFNIRGQEVVTLVNNTMEAGIHNITFDASQLNTGVYFYEMTAGNFHEVKRMTFVK
ncbi:PKD domain-containing protein, partial [bacterium]|nr:PKD domain-containing protein [bacterium]